MEEFYVDIHCHPTMRAFNTTPLAKNRNLWDKTQTDFVPTRVGKWAWKASKDVSKHSQSNFYNCVEGKTRIVFDSLYPIEKGFINFKKSHEFIVGKKAMDTLGVTASGISVERFKEYKASSDYFSELLSQYNFLVSNLGESPCGKYKSRIAKNYTDLIEALNADSNSVNIVLSIEGAHAFGCGTRDTELLSVEELKAKLKKNIEAVKKWEYPPFFITFAHHFWNQLCGHATTLKNAAKIACDQSKGLDLGFTELGEFVLEELLSTKNGKRILIDTRHMSVNARIHYFNYVKKHNQNNPNDLIPLISSHSAVNGFNTLSESVVLKDNSKKKKHTTYCAWSLNISAEEVVAIHESGGIAGVILDKGRHCGINILKNIDKITDLETKKEAFVKMICDNIFFYISSVNKKTAWDVLTIGSDFDGVITHFDCYDEMSKLPELKKDIVNYLTKTNYKKELWFNYSPTELMDKLFTQNAMDFLKRNFK